MSEHFYELAIEGPTGRTLGFVEGFLAARGAGDRVLDAYRAGFDCESLRERIRELLHRSKQTYHLLVPADLVPAAEEAVQEGARRGMEIEIRDQRSLRGARFRFSFRTYSREAGARLRAMLESPPAPLRCLEPSFVETIDPDSKGIEAYAPAHDYELEGSGVIEGEVLPTLQLHRRCRKEELITLGDLDVVPAG